LGSMLFEHLEKRQRILILFRLCRVKTEREEKSSDRTVLVRKRGRGKESILKLVVPSLLVCLIAKYSMLFA